MKRVIILIITIITLLSATSVTTFASENTILNGEAKSVILMEAVTGKVLYEYQADLRLPPASVTKIMTILLIMEEIDKGNLKLTDTVQVSERASKMGGSQVYLKAGEIMSVEDLLKSIVVASANDASVALAERVSGSVEAFVSRMNERARELGMLSTNFENPTGLDDSVTDHLISARDIAIMSRELIRHKDIFKYTMIWTDTIRDGAFGLSNTNRLIRFYEGANGLKTGSTSKAGFCISATAERNGMQLIAVVMGSPTRDSRNETAKALLDYGFANYRFYHSDPKESSPIKVLGGIKDYCPLITESFDFVLTKDIYSKGITVQESIPENVKAPIKAGDKIGEAVIMAGDQVIGTAFIRAAESINRLTFSEILKRLIGSFFYS